MITNTWTFGDFIAGRPRAHVGRNRSSLRSAVCGVAIALAAACPSLGRIAADEKRDEKSKVEADVVIRQVTIHDGSGGPAIVGDLAIRGDRIVGVGTIQVAGSPREINGRGLIAAPGFIDLHSHSDPEITKDRLRVNDNFLWQGVTTVVTGNCGGGEADTAAYLKRVEQGGAGTNVAHLIPHGAIRRIVMKDERRPPTDAELERMRKLVDEGMRAGAWGISTGLIYVPSKYAEIDELVELSKVVAKYKGVYASHIRNEGSGLLRAIEEALSIGRRAGVAVHISHIKVSGRSAWGLSAEAVRVIEAARADGMKVTADQYPYVASSTSLAAMVIPDDVQSKERLEAALADPQRAEKLRADLRSALAARDGGKSLVVARYSPRPKWQGRDLAAIGRDEQRDPVEIVIEIQRGGGAQMVSFGMSEEEVRFFMRFPFVATASDGGTKVPDDTVPHPRSYGTFPRRIGRYALEERVVPVEAAIRSATGLPADILGMTDRGYLRVGQFADIVVFDPVKFRDQATFDQPHQYAAGVRWLLVNGTAAIEDGKLTAAAPGARTGSAPAKDADAHGAKDVGERRALAGRALRRP